MINIEMQNKYLIFEVDERYAIEIEKVIEIIELMPITKVPETPSYIEGVINLRGQVIPVISLRERFKKPAKRNAKRNCIIIISFDEIKLGLIVDTVLDLILIPADMVSPPPQVGSEYAHVFIKSIGVSDGQMNLILDGDKIINYSDIEFLNG